MRILYVNHGPQAGVTAAVVQRLLAAGHEVRLFDPVDGFLYERQLGRLRVPNMALDPVLAIGAAVARFRRRWKPWSVRRMLDVVERGAAPAARAG